MKTIAVIVTYADRFNLLKEVVTSCFSEGVKKIIIVDNNSHSNSKTSLKILKEQYNDQIIIQWNKSNLGSAKAYKQGLERAYGIENCDYIWLLDDDNKPRKQSLQILKDFWGDKKSEIACLLSYRPDRVQYKKAIQQRNPELVLSKKNSFYGFHILDKISKIFTNKKTLVYDDQFGEISYAPYGGMFFHKSLLDIIGYPDENFFLYSDDHDWSYRITDSGKKIFLVLNSIIDDIDTSWGVTKNGKRTNVFLKIKDAPSLRVYYTLRNRMIFEKKYLVTNKLMYNLNVVLFTFFLFCFCLNNKNFKVFKQAIKDAKENNLNAKYEDLYN